MDDSRHLSEQDRPLEITEDLGRYLVCRSKSYWLLESIRLEDRLREIDREPPIRIPNSYTPEEGLVLYGVIRSRVMEKRRIEKDIEEAKKLSA